jgi:hypothetical protein
MGTENQSTQDINGWRCVTLGGIIPVVGDKKINKYGHFIGEDATNMFSLKS